MEHELDTQPDAGSRTDVRNVVLRCTVPGADRLIYLGRPQCHNVQSYPAKTVCSVKC